MSAKSGQFHSSENGISSRFILNAAWICIAVDHVILVT